MEITLSKTDYLLFRECPKNVWYKIHTPDIYYKRGLSDFERHLVETGNEVELVARQLFPAGVLIEGRDEAAQKMTQEYIAKNTPTLFQPVFVKNGFMAAVDVLQWNKKTGGYSLYEIKASNSIDEKRHHYDLAFQANLLKRFGMQIDSIHLLHLNSEYVRRGALNVQKLFIADDITYTIRDLGEEVAREMEQVLQYIKGEKEPPGACACIYKGRSSHCTTFWHANPHVPEYSIHDLTRIGVSKKKLIELVDTGRFHLHEVPDEMKLSEPQRNQIATFMLNRPFINGGEIEKELKNLQYPLYFIDYETFPAAIPMCDGFSPYQQIPFQYSLFVVEKPGAELKHFEFLHDVASDPSEAFVESLRAHLGRVGHIIVWSKQFECGINKQIAKRIPAAAQFIDEVNGRVYDLRDIFTKQYYVHKNFMGSTSLKRISPVMAPELSYKELAIQEGGAAASSWLKLVRPELAKSEKEQLKQDMLAYCKLDAYAMVRIFEELQNR